MRQNFACSLMSFDIFIDAKHRRRIELCNGKVILKKRSAVS
jgi:hypothetical protein